MASFPYFSRATSSKTCYPGVSAHSYPVPSYPTYLASFMQGLGPSDQTWLEAFSLFLIENLDSDLLSIPELATQFAMSESTLLRTVKRLTGLSPISYIQCLRLECAYALLSTDQTESVKQVAQRVGYQHACSFSRSFKQRFGVSPSDLAAGSYA